MDPQTLSALVAAALVLAAHGAAAEPVLDAARVVDIAQRRAPEVLEAAARIEQAVGRRDGAPALATRNPTVGGGAGQRWGASPPLELEAELEIPIPLAGRGGRVAVADADVLRARHEAADVRRRAIGVALAAYYRALHAAAVEGLARQRQDLAVDLQGTALDRQRAGDASQFEVNLAEIEVARAESDAVAAGAFVARARAALALALGLEPGGFRISGDLSDRRVIDAALGRADVGERPDVRAARAEVSRARAELDLAGVAWVPELSLHGTYAREEGTDAVRGGLAVSLPIFSRGQGLAREASGHHREAALALTARRAAVRTEVDAARRAYAALVEAARRLEALGVRRALESETMAREAYRMGRLDLPSLILIRRDAIETRREHADRVLDAALAGVDLAVARGAFDRARTPSPVPFDEGGAR